MDNIYTYYLISCHLATITVIIIINSWKVDLTSPCKEAVAAENDKCEVLQYMKTWPAAAEVFFELSQRV